MDVVEYYRLIDDAEQLERAVKMLRRRYKASTRVSAPRSPVNSPRSGTWQPADGGTASIISWLETQAVAWRRKAEEYHARPPEECKGFRWIGQPWSSCDGCGRPWQEHEGLLSPAKEVTLQDVITGQWVVIPWSELPPSRPPALPGRDAS